MNFGTIKRIHFVGIGGIGMSGLAEILQKHGFAVSGCDAKASSTTSKLQSEGIHVNTGHAATHAHECDALVVSSAIRKDHPELLEARGRKIPVVRRAEMLGEIVRRNRSVAVSGTHGKTSTSAMAAMVLSEGGLDPTLIVGGVLRNLDSNAKLGKSDLLVVEADEYDRSFLALWPQIAIATNIDADHLDCYQDLDDIREAFRQFLERVPFYGLVIGCADDPYVAEIMRHIDRRVMRYGVRDEAELRPGAIRYTERGSTFTVELNREPLGIVELRVPGLHNILNALAAIAAGLELGVPFDTIAAALSRYEGVERRFQLLGEFNGAVIVDDYAHHPTEIRATLEAARGSYPDRRIVALFQPHLYSRTRDFFDQFAESLSIADAVLVTPIYPAREEPMPGVDSRLILDAARRRGAGNIALTEDGDDALLLHLRELLRPGDIFLTLGAGDVNRFGIMLAGADK